MNPEPPSKKIYLEIPIDVANPLLLEGLETWLRLGLLNERQVQKICQQYLICSLPEVPILSPADSLQVVNSQAAIRLAPARIKTNPLQSFLSQFITSFREELSLRWLLFLGLFLVIVSSGVLAATQWQKFPPIGQYLILWCYTLVFWGIGFWSKRQSNLQLTSQTLQTIALFLIPINFWAMDTFGLGKQSLGITIVVVATLSLLGIYVFSRQTNLNLIGQGNYLVLNFLHWGWQSTVFTIPAIYLGTFLTAIDLTFFHYSRQEQNEIEKASFSKTLLLYGLFILLVRGIFFIKLSLASLGLAIGLYGWLLRKPTEEATILDKVLDSVGVILLVFGWGVALFHDATGQALAITGLGLHYFWQRLRKKWRLGDLFAIFLIGFQSLFLLEDIIPIWIRETVSNGWIQVSQTSDYAPSIYSLTFFPYILLWVGFTGWLSHQEKPKLARFGEWLSLGLGVCLTVLSLEAIASRSLNLLLSTSTLVYFVSSRPIRVPLIYFTHSIGLLSLVSWIDWCLPSLDLSRWGYSLILLTAGEWLNSLRYQPLSFRNKKQWWYLSSWHFGFILAISSFIVFLSLLSTYFATGNKQSSILAWLLVPTFLTIISALTRKKRSRQAALLSSYGFVFAQFLTFWQPGIRLISLGLAAVVMLMNSFYYKRPLTARLPILFILILGCSWIVEKSITPGNLIEVVFLPEWVLFDGIYLTLLWLARDWLKHQNNRLASIYSLALDQVAIVLCIFELIRLSLHAYLVTIGELNSSWQWLVTAILIAFSLIYRFWKEPKEIAVYGLLLNIEVLVIEGVFGLKGTVLLVSLVNLFLAILSFCLTHWLFSRFPHLSRLKSLQISPLLFAVMVIIWRFGEFTAYTGLLTLGVAIVGLFVSSRFLDNKALVYLSLMGISLAFNEIIIYQFWTTNNILLGNRLILLSLMQVGLAFSYRLVIWQRRIRGFEFIRHISLETLEIIADLNWVIAIPFKILGLIVLTFLAFNLNPHPLYLIFSLAISAYALFKARYSNTKDRWFYLGFIDIYLTAIFARWIWQQLETLDPYFGLITAVIALIIYHLPWQQWGWNLKPWRNIAYSLSIITAILTFSEISNLSLFSIAAFYTYLAFHQRTIRWSYVTVVILNWILFRFFDRQNLTDILYYTSTIGLSMLYLAQVEPKLQESRNRKIRHYLRILGSSIINVTAFVFHQETGLTPGIISLLTILIGLGLKMRAFLLVGTITFILTVFYQLVVLSFQYTLLKWIIGLVVGIVLITVAANFERRREQMLSLVRNSLEQLSRWE
jgi:hypothetical protein